MDSKEKMKIAEELIFRLLQSGRPGVVTNADLSGPGDQNENVTISLRACFILKKTGSVLNRNTANEILGRFGVKANDILFKDGDYMVHAQGETQKMVLVLFQAETDADDTMSLVVALSEPSPTVSELSGMHEDEAKALFTISLTQKANAMAADYDAMAKLIVSR